MAQHVCPPVRTCSCLRNFLVVLIAPLFLTDRGGASSAQAEPGNNQQSRRALMSLKAKAQ
jgi:hypothetical protein